ncbi:MAG: transcriptional regulator [Anaerolineales bacterium]|nr:transcriptional regulator [Anaerolineales bacterium]
MTTLIPPKIQSHWQEIQPLFALRNEQEYDLAVERLNNLIDEVGTDEAHPLYELLDTLGTLITAYEEQHYPMPACSGAEMLRFFMDEHGLVQADLAEIGSQGVVSEILNGKRELNTRQIRLLAQRFNISPAAFF